MTPSDRPPYPGLRAFKRDETDLFFGRDTCVEKMIERLAATRFLAVLGSSGTGKSSLVKTGLLSGLEMGLLKGAGSNWRIVDFRPEGAPLRNLARRLLETERQESGQADEIDPLEVTLLRARLNRGPRALIEWCREGHLAARTNLLLLVDQFEELFRYEDYAGREEAEAFVALLLESRHPTEFEHPQHSELPIYVTLTMRSEYLGACALIEGLAEAINEGTYLTPRMTRDECRDAIVGPARVCGIEIEPVLVTRLLNDLGGFAPWDDSSKPDRLTRFGSRDQLSRLARRADQLPVMQHALNQMWSEATVSNKDRNVAEQPVTLTLDEYTAIGEVTGAINRHATSILKKLGPERAPVAETIFRALTTGTTVANAVRRPMSFGELVKMCGGDRDAVRAVVDAFRAPGCNFLLPEVDQKPELDDEAKIDITHESLIRQWELLSTWLEKEGRAAHDWQRLNEDAERAELLTGRRLANAIALREEVKPTPAWAGRYGIGIGHIDKLIDDSILVRNEEEQREERRRAAELRRAKNTVYAALAILACVALLAGYAVQKKREADKAVVEIAKANAELVQQKILVEEHARHAEEKAREASLALQDFVAETRSSRDRLLESNKTIADVTDTLVARSSPVAALDARNKRHFALTKIGDHGGAIAELDAMLAVDPDNVPALSSRGYEYLTVGRAADAIKDITKALSLRPTTSTYGNLAIAKAILRDYDAAIDATKKAIESYLPPQSVFDSDVSPDIERATGHTLITVENYEFRIALGYQLALYHAFKGGEGFLEALKEADRVNLDQQEVQAGGPTRSPAMNAYLVALNWAWQSSVWQYPDQIGVLDYGVYAAEGALWERVAAIQPRYFDWARLAYERFRKAYEKRPEPRYEVLSAWVNKRLATKEITAVASSPVRTAESHETVRDRRALALQAKELKAKRQGTTALSIGEAHRLISDAIDLLDKERAVKGTKRPDLTDHLISLLLDRADWRFDAGDRKGARADARRIVEELNPNVATAHWMLAKTEVDDEARRRHYERALKSNPAHTATLWDFSRLLADIDAGRALELQQRRLKFVTQKSTGYEEVAKLQLKLGLKDEALESVNTAISIVPFRTRLFELRRDIQVALGWNRDKVTAHLAAGYRQAGDYYARSGDNAEALSLYLQGLDTAIAIPNPEDDDMRFEVETAIRSLSEFIASRYSRTDAQRFWQSLAGVSISKNYRARLQQEAVRMGAPR